MSIFKETFRDFVFEQLRLREAILKQGMSNTNRFGTREVELKIKDQATFKVTPPAGAFWTNTVHRQCTIRMCSGVNLKPANAVLEEGGFETNKDLADEGLAIRYILEGGIPEKSSADFIKEDQTSRDLKSLKNIKVNPRGKNFKNFGKGYGGSYGDPFIRSDAKDGYGIVPMPGIIDATIRTKSAYGSLREAKIKFTCHNRRQLEILELLYMRPGFPILLEWGWAPYITIERHSETGQPLGCKREDYFPYMWEWFEKNSRINDINKKIIERKKLSGGNYDGFVGFCKNFKFNSRPDGGYDCETELIAMGEVLEGLKGRRTGKTLVDADNPENVREVDDLEFYITSIKNIAENLQRFGTYSRFEKETVKKKEIKKGDFLQSFENAQEFVKDFNDLIPDLGDSNLTDENIDNRFAPFNAKGGKTNYYNERRKKSAEAGLHPNRDKAVKQVAAFYQEIEEALDNFIIAKGEPLHATEDAVNYNFSDKDSVTFFRSPRNYIRWDFLVTILNNFVLARYQEGTKGPPETITEITCLRNPLSNDTNTKKQNLRYNQYSFKGNLTKEHGLDKVTYDQLPQDKDQMKKLGLTFLLRTKIAQATRYSGGVNVEEVVDSSFNPHVCLLPHQIAKAQSFAEETDTHIYTDRDISFIFLDLEHILKVYKELRYDGENLNEDFSIFDWLQKIWDDVSKACAGTHNFTLHVEHERPNIARVVDLGFQQDELDKDLLPENLFELKIQSNESIVRDFKYNTTIPSALSATIAVAAQAPNSVSDIDAVTFSAFNKDIYYRFYIPPPDEPKPLSAKELAEKEAREKKKKDRLRNKLQTDIDKYRVNVAKLFVYRDEIMKGLLTDDAEGTATELTAEKCMNIAKNMEGLFLSIVGRYPLNHEKAGEKIRKPTASKSAVVPLKFNAQLDGISGIVIGNVFKIDKTRLPAGYQGDEIGFVVMGENQKISDGGDWVTEIQGQLVILDLAAKDDVKEPIEEKSIFFKALQNVKSMVPEKDPNPLDEVDKEETPEVDEPVVEPVAQVEEPEKIAIEYTYDWKATLNDEGDLWVYNNAGYPSLGQGMANVISQGGSDKIIENKKFTMDNMGTMMDGILFPKTGTMVEPYNGNKTEVSQGTTTFPSQ